VTLGATGGSDPLTTPIHHGNLFGRFDNLFSFNFLQGSGQGTQNSDLASVSTGGTVDLVQAGTNTSTLFNLAQGDKLDLSQILAGAPVNQDLSNISQYVKVIGHGPNDPGFGQGTQTVLQITGPNGQAIVHLEGSGRLNVHDLVKNDAIIPPTH
jgi:hypothetical protein